jgi:hypothetical protein
MAGKTTEQLAEETLKIRLEVHRRMVEGNLSENEALRQVLPTDRNRTKKLRLWRKKGLWPLPESGTVGTVAQVGSTLPNDSNSAIQRMSVTDGLTETELLKKVRAMLDTIEPAQRPVGATAKGRKSPLQTTMIAIRIPTVLDEELKSMGGLKSHHIEKAIMLYLKAMRIDSEPDA